MSTFGTMVTVKVGKNKVDLNSSHQLCSFIKSRLHLTATTSHSKGRKRQLLRVTPRRIRLTRTEDNTINAELRKLVQV